MKFDDLDARLRVFETAHDHCALPGLYLVARLDGRGFTRLTKEVHAFAAPFDERMRDYMAATTRHLLDCGFRTVYGYTQSDEISLLLHPDEASFGRKLRKYISVLAGEASATFSLQLGAPGVFDCRISQLPRPSDVVDYFRWRQEDAGRNALNAHCYWLLRQRGHSVAEATAQVKGQRTSAKHDLLFGHGINYNDLPAWQKRGVGVYWEDYQSPAAAQSVRPAGPRGRVLGRLPKVWLQPPHPNHRRNHPPPPDYQLRAALRPRLRALRPSAAAWLIGYPSSTP